jgi:hypothetical protein
MLIWMNWPDKLSPLADINLDETGSRTKGLQYDLRLPDQREGQGDFAIDTAEHHCESL